MLYGCDGWNVLKLPIPPFFILLFLSLNFTTTFFWEKKPKTLVWNSAGTYSERCQWWVNILFMPGTYYCVQITSLRDVEDFYQMHLIACWIILYLIWISHNLQLLMLNASMTIQTWYSENLALSQSQTSSNKTTESSNRSTSKIILKTFVL